MKYIIIILLSVSMSYASCGNKANTTTDKSEQQGKEYTSAYVCPMHCDGSGSHEAGKCPVCGMDYVENKDHHSDGHEH